MNDPISDFLTRIRNVLMIGRSKVIVNYSKIITKLTEILLAEGYINSFQIHVIGNKKYLELSLKYRYGKSVIIGLRRLSRIGLRVYSSVHQIPLIRDGMGLIIVSTSRGLMSGRKAKKINMGGELICSVW